MVNDAPDWTDNINIVGSTVTLNIAIQSSAITLNVNIASSAATLNVNLSASAITLNISITAQTLGVADPGAFASFNSNQLYFGTTGLQAQNVWVNAINITPAGPALFYLQSFTFGIQNPGGAVVYIQARVTVGGTVELYDNASPGSAYFFGQPLPVGVGVTMNLDLWGNSSVLGNITVISSIAGFYK